MLKKKHYQSVIYRLNPDQDQHFVGPDLGSNCEGFQQLSKTLKGFFFRQRGPRSLMVGHVLCF